MATPNTWRQRDPSLSGGRASTRGGAGAQQHHLLVMAPGIFARHPLPEDKSELVIGRGGEADVSVEDPRASRQHCKVHFSAGAPVIFAVEDLGSGNGTTVRGTRLTPNERVTILAGEAIALGDTIVMVQKNHARTRRPRVFDHDEFGNRVEWECTRAEAARSGFSVLRVRVDGTVTQARLQEIVASALRPIDVLGVYGPGELEVLLTDVQEPAAASLESALELTLADAGLVPRLAAAHFPQDGRHAEALIGQANARLRALVPLVSVSVAGGEGAGHVAVGKPGGMIVDEGMREVWTLVQHAAASAINVLVLGETGAGKEVIARAVHDLSERATSPFVVVNCAALAESLLENELFGHEKGAFTGAAQAQEGIIESAHGGTVFLDEIGELPFALQAKLLRVLENKEITRLGSVRPRAIDVRFVAATNRDLESEAGSGTFRRDLYFRLAGLTLDVPPLRERPGAVALLARRFIAEVHASERVVKAGTEHPLPRLSDEALALLENHAWPGNVRELRNVIERAMLLRRGVGRGTAGRGDVIDRQHLPAEKMQTPARSVSPVPIRGEALTPDPAAGVDPERQKIVRALKAAAGNQSRAAQALGISRKVLLARLEKFGITRPRKGQKA